MQDTDSIKFTIGMRRDEMLSSKCDARDILRRRIPIIAWLPLYTWSKLLQDCLAGLAVGLTAIPQGIAYAIVAGLPAQYGLYSGFMGCFMYLIFGSSKDITIGPTAIMSLMTQQYVAKLGYDAAVLLCFLSGCIILLLGLLHLGFLVDFISMPVTSGFTSAAAITIAVSQFKSLLGLSGSANGFVDSLILVFSKISQTNIWDLLLGLCSIVVLILLKNFPGKRQGNAGQKLMWVISLGRNAVVVILGTLLTYIFSVNGLEPFNMTGAIQAGLPSFSVPPFSTTHNNQTYNFLQFSSEIGTGIISVPLIAILESIAIAKAFGKGRSLDATQEMLALGISNICGSFVRSLPTTGSFTRTAVNNASGVQTQMGGIVTGSLVLLACGLLTATFEFIPKSTLAAVIIVAMYYMLEFHTFGVLWRTKKIDLIPLTVTLICCLFLGLEYGMLVGIMANLILLLYFTARPGVFIEEQHVDGVSILLVTPAQSLSFPAAEYLREEVVSRCALNKRELLPVVLDGRHVHRIDATVAKNLKLLQTDMESRKQSLVFWNWNELVQQTLKNYDATLSKHFRNEAKLEDVFKKAKSTTRDDEHPPGITFKIGANEPTLG